MADDRDEDGMPQIIEESVMIMVANFQRGKGVNYGIDARPTKEGLLVTMGPLEYSMYLSYIFLNI
jgi:hypothetical protein